MIVLRKILGRVGAASAVALVAVCFAVPSASADTAACTITWKTTASTRDWHTAANWNEARIPVNGDHVCIPGGIGTAPVTYFTGGGVTLGSINSETPLSITGGTFGVDDAAVDSTLAALSFSGGTITGSAELQISGSLNWNAGAMAGSGTTNLLAGSTATIVGGSASFAPWLENTRVLRLQGTTTLTTGTIYARGGGSTPIIRNEGLFSITGGTAARSIAASPTPTPKLQNTGTFRTTGSGNFFTDWAIDNDGAVSAQGGSITLERGDATETQSGSFGGTGVVNLTAGTFNLSGGEQFVGTVNFQGATFNMNGDVEASATVAMTSGTVSGSGNFTIDGHLNIGNGSWLTTGTTTISSGTFTWSGGVLGSSGTTIVDTGTAMTLPNIIYTGRAISGSHHLINRGNATWSAAAITASGAGATPRFSNEGLMTLTGGGGAATIQSASPAPAPKWHNTGTIRTTGTAGLSINWPIDNDGVIDAQGGAISLHNGDPTESQSGSFGGAGGAGLTYLYAGTFNLSGGDQLFGRTMISGAGVHITGDVNATGLLEFTAGHVTADGDVNIDGDLSFTFGFWGGSGTTTVNNGTLSWYAGTFGESGTTVIAPDAELELPVNHATSVRALSGTRSFVNEGTVYFRGSSVHATGAGSSPSFTNAGTLIGTGYGGAFRSLSASPAPNPTWHNTGTVLTSGTAGLSIDWLNDNDGVIDAQGGAISLHNGDGSAIQSGSFGGDGQTILATGTFNLSGGDQFFGRTSLSGAGVHITGDVQVAGSLEQNAGHVFQNGDIEVNGALKIGGGVWEGTGSMSVQTGEFVWSGGTLGGTGHTTISPAASMDLTSTMLPAFYPRIGGSREIINWGSGVWTTGTIVVGEADSDVAIRNHGTLELGSMGLRPPGVDASAQLTNTGEIRKTGTGNGSISWWTENDGSVDVQGGSLSLYSNSNATSSGDFSASGAGSKLYLNTGRVFRLAGGNALGKPGDLGAIQVGDLQLNGDISSSGRVETWLGSITGPGDFVFQGVMDMQYINWAGDGDLITKPGSTIEWRSGTFSGTGSTVIESGATMLIKNGGGSFSGTRTLNNYGTVQLEAGSVRALDGGATDVLFRNAGLFKMAPMTAMSKFFNTERARIVNTGAIELPESIGITPVYWTIENDGLIDVPSGELRTASLSTTDDSLVRLGFGNSASETAKVTMTTPVRIAGNLIYDVNGSFTPTIGQQFTAVASGLREGEFGAAAVSGMESPPAIELTHEYGNVLATIAEPAPESQGFAAFALFGDAGSGGGSQEPESNSSIPDAFGFSASSTDVVTSARISPQIDFETTADDPDVVPGDDPGFTAQVRNGGAELELTGSIEVNGLEAPATLSSLLAYLEYRDATTGAWIPLSGTIENLPGHTPEFVPPVASNLDLVASAIPEAGVAYGATPTGTVISAGATARWNTNVTAELTPEQLDLLTDSARTSGIRYVHRAELLYVDEDCPDPQVAGEPVVAAIASPVQAQTGSLHNARIDATLPDGREVTFDAANTPELAELAAGEEVTVDLAYAPEVEGERGETESQSDYVNRLTAENGKSLSATATLTGQTQTAGSGEDVPVLEDIDPFERSSSATQYVPIVSLDKTGPDLADAGSTVVYDLALRNNGGTTATPTVTDTVETDPQPVVAAPTELEPSASATAQANVTAPTDGTEVTDVGSVTWTDRNGNEYGPITDSYTTQLSPSVEQPQAPPVDTEAPVQTFDQETSFLYEGDDKIQNGVAEGTIDPQRVGVLRGTVKDRDGQLLSGVKVTVLGRPEYGSTVTRVDGGFYMAVNGGEPLTLGFEKVGYLQSQRRAEPDWNDYTWIDDDVVLVSLEESVDEIELGAAATAAQVAQSEPVTDESGTRRSTLIFNPNTTATAIKRDGTEVPLETASVRSSEYTVGPNGPQAMPGELPPTSAYTYAAALTADEALAIGADHVFFNQPVINYVENFLEFPVGQEVPSGYQDPKSRVWVPDESGRVVEVLDEGNGLAVLDVNGDGVAATPVELEELGIGEEELAKVAELYDLGDSLWRVPVTHFSDHSVPIAMAGGGIDPDNGVSVGFDPDDNVLIVSGKDYNWNFKLPPDAEPPPGVSVTSDGCKDAKRGGSIIECESQSLSESIQLEGIPADISYATNRMDGFEDNRSFTVPLSGDEVPESLASINVVINVAGRREIRVFDPEPNQEFTYVWDGKDAFGREVTGSRDIEIRVGYAYRGVYGSTASFSQPTTPQPARPNFIGSPYFLSADLGRRQWLIWQTHEGTVSQFNPEWAGLGGWSLDFHHFYDPKSARLYRGDGSIAAASPVKLRKLQSQVGTGIAGASGDDGPAAAAQLREPQSLAAMPDGSTLIADTLNNKIRRVASDGTVSTFAGTGGYGFSGDGGPAASAKLAAPKYVSVGPGGVVYIADTNNNRIRVVDSDGVISTVAGGGPESPTGGDGGLAVNARLSQPSGVFAASWGDVFIADTNNNRIRRVLPDGKIHNYAGTGRAAFTGDGDLALEADLNQPHGLKIDRDGNLLIADTRNNRIRKVDPNGSIVTVAGGGASQDLGDFERATDARLSLPIDIALTPSGDIYIADTAHSRIRRVTPDGFIASAADAESEVIPYPGVTASTQGLARPGGVAISPEGTVLIADTEHHRVLRFASIEGGFDVNNSIIPSPDGSEIYEFSPRGQHLRTADAKTGATLYSFEYDGGLLLKAVDGDGNEINVEHEDGHPASITGPYGQSAELETDGQGRLESVTTPSGATYGITYESGVLLKTFTMPNGATSTMTYDQHGRLAKDENAAGGFSALTRTDTEAGHRVEAASALGRTTTYDMSDGPDGYTREITDPAGNTQSSTTRPDGSVVSSDADGTRTTSKSEADPRLGLYAPFTSAATLTLPSDRALSSTSARSSTLANPDDPLTLTQETTSSTVNGKTTQTQFTRTAPIGQQPAPNSQVAEVTAESPAGRESTMTADAFGRPLTISQPGYEDTAFTYDARGRLAGVTTGTRASTYAYDQNGFVQSATDPAGRTTTFEYDAAGRTTATTLPGGRRVEMTYDVNGNLTSLTPPSRPAHSFSHNLIDLLTGQSAPEVSGNTRTTTYQYDADQAMTKATRPSGAEITMDYDSAGRLAATASPDGEATFDYSAQTGDLTSATSDDGQQTAFAYDGPLTESIEQSGTANGAVDFSYDTDFRTSAITTPGGTTNLTYDQDSLLTAAGSMTLTRNPASGQLTATQLGGTNSTLTYNPHGEPASETTSFPGGQYQETYQRDALGRITTRTEVSASGTTTFDYSYDQAGRLTEVERNGSPYRAYTFDANGNRLSTTKQTPSGPETQPATFDAQDRQTTSGPHALTYNANGELTEKRNTSTDDSLTLTYKTSGDLASATTPTGTLYTFEYDAAGNRTAEFKDGNLKAAYLYAPGISGPLAKVDQSGTEQARFIYATRSHVPDFMVQGSNTYRLVTDQLGSVRFVVNASTGAVTQELEYDPFGEVTTDTNPGFQPFGYAGGLYESETGLTHFGAREYDAELGRWTSSDPIGFGGGDTNLYGYVVQDPINLNDPNGKIPSVPSPPTLIPDIEFPDINFPDIDWPENEWPFPVPCPPLEARWEPVLTGASTFSDAISEVPVSCADYCDESENGDDAPDPEPPEGGGDGPYVPPPTPSPGWDPKPVPKPKICVIPTPRGPIPVPC